MKTTKMLPILVFALGLMACIPKVSEAVPMGTAWTYQGMLMDVNEPADGEYDFQFKLYDAPNGGVQQGSTIDVNDLDIIDGYFTVELDFGSGVFDGDARWLEMGIRPGDSNDPNAFVTPSPRQEVTPTPYSLYAQNAGTDNDWIVSGSSMYSIPGRVGIGTTDPGITSLFVQRPSAVSPFVVFQDGLVIKNGNRCIGNQLEVQDSSGNTQFVVTGTRVGIGTSSPDRTLEISGVLRVAREANNAHGADFSYIVDEPVTGHDGLIIDSDTGGGWSDIHLRTLGTTKLFVESGGKVGIGTTSPGTGLHVKGTGWPDAFMSLQSDANEDAGIRLYEGDTVKWHIYNSSSDDGLVILNSTDYTPVLFAEQSTGNVRVRVLEITGGDLVEGFDTGDVTCKPGTVMVINSKNPGQLAPSTTAYDRKVAGVVSGAGGVTHGIQMGKQEALDGDTLIALTGRVYCWVDASNSPIEPGDLLTTSNTPGHAMKVMDYEKAQGAILGKAMTRLESGEKGLVLVLVALQ
jgi:hypothetical protein